MNTLKMQLFITGRTSRSDSAIENLHTTLEENKIDHFELNIIDVLDNPHEAEDNLILATPTLIKLAPVPAMRVIGDLSDRKVLLSSLAIEHNES